MRITSGWLKGRRIKVTSGKRVRPTSAKVRQAVFNLVGERLKGARVLDLFSGSGALGIEALSRGAISAYFVDIDPLVIKVLKDNLSACGLMDRAQVIKAEVLRFLKRGNKDEPFQVIFADPPYGRGIAQSCLLELAKGGWLGKGSVLIVEHSRWESLAERAGGLVLVNRKSYGDTMVSLYSPETEGNSVGSRGVCCNDGEGTG